MTADAQFATLTGRSPAQLANAVSDAIAAAQTRGMEVDECLCVVATVIADYARIVYGDDYLDRLAGIMAAQKSRPKPEHSFFDRTQPG